jgi:hypothetical protein
MPLTERPSGNSPLKPFAGSRLTYRHAVETEVPSGYRHQFVASSYTGIRDIY